MVAKVKKLILVTATHHPLHKVFSKLLDEMAEKLSVEKEVKHEDYMFLIKYGETDEFGMAGTPQLLVELDDGRIVPVLTQRSMPLTDALKPDLDKAREIIMSKIKELTE